MVSFCFMMTVTVSSCIQEVDLVPERTSSGSHFVFEHDVRAQFALEHDADRPDRRAAATGRYGD